MTQQGEGADLVFIHGWGMNAEIWRPLIEALDADCRVSCVDLPGHGENPYDVAWSIDDFIRDLDKLFSNPVCLIGWSLGGMIALRYSILFPEKVSKLVMLASSAKFTQAEDWPFAQPASVLQAFTESISSSPKVALRRFCLFQTQGMEQPRSLDKQMKLFINESPTPKIGSLLGGLSLLGALDLRTDLKQTKVPLLMLLGDNDELIPRGVAEASKELNSDIKVSFIKGAAHLPLLSHIDETAEQIQAFCSHE
jgi:pimeloyl-[acyl-carrier protein] methyl ester esterase